MAKKLIVMTAKETVFMTKGIKFHLNTTEQLDLYNLLDRALDRKQKETEDNMDIIREEIKYVDTQDKNL